MFKYMYVIRILCRVHHIAATFSQPSQMVALTILPVTYRDYKEWMLLTGAFFPFLELCRYIIRLVKEMSLVSCFGERLSHIDC